MHLQSIFFVARATESLTLGVVKFEIETTHLPSEPFMEYLRSAVFFSGRYSSKE